MIRRLLLLLGAALACSVMPMRPANATVVIPADVTELAHDAAAIAHGRIVRIEAQQGEGRRVERIVTLQVFEYFKGGWGNVVQFRLPGGTLGRYRTVMIGAPELEVGDELVLFLGARDDARPYLLGLHQGVFRVVADQATGKRLVMPPVVQGSDSAPSRRGDASRRPLDLGEFQGRIATALAAPRAAAKAAARGNAAARSGR